MKGLMKVLLTFFAIVLSLTVVQPIPMVTIEAATSKEPVLTAKTSRDTGIMLEWKAGNRVQNSSNIKYTILRMRDDGYYSGLATRDPKYGLFYLDASNLIPGKEYTYKVRETVNGVDVDSNEVTVKAVSSGAAENEFTDKNKAADYVKKQMVGRKKSFTIIYNSSTFPSGLGPELYDMAREDEEKSNTASAVEGDYLRYTIKPGTIKFSSGIDGKIGNLTSYTFTFSLDYYTTKSEEEVVDRKVAEILDGFQKKGVTKDASDYVKAKAVYDYLATNLHYNNEARPDNGNLMITAYDSLVRKEAQCYGQTLGAYRLLKELGMVTRRVNGELYLSDTNETIVHGWNIVLIDGKWYNLDATGAATYFEETNAMTYKKLLKPYTYFEEQGYTLSEDYAPSSVFGKAHPFGTKVYPVEPEAPTNLYLKNLGNGKVQATFPSVSSAEGYVLYRSTSATGKFEQVAEGKTTTLVDNNATPGVEYHYKVKVYATVSGDRLYSAYSPRRIITSKSTGTPEFVEIKANSTNVTLNWNKIDGAEYYQLYRSDSENGKYALVNRKNYATNKVEDNEVNAGQTYYYKVRAFKDEEYGMFSDIKKVTTKPMKTSGVKASSVGATTVKVEWEKSAGAKYYQVYRSANGISGFKLLGTYDANTTSMNSKALNTYQTYYYKVRSYTVVDKKGIYSDFSTIVKAAPKFTAPKNIMTAQNTSTTLKISWNLTDGGAYYQVYRSTSKDGKYALLGVYDSNTTSSISKSLRTGTTYYYKVRAYRWISGERVFSPFSSVVSGKPELQKISKVTAQAQTSTTAKITWNKIEGATYYQVYRGTSVNGKYALLGTYDSNTTSSISRSLKKGSTYYYKVRTYKWVNGERVFSPFSTPINVKI